MDAVRGAGPRRHLGTRGIGAGRSILAPFAYALGLGVPFLLVGAFVAQASRFINRWTKAFHYVTIAFGVLLIVLGILVFTQDLSLVANFGFVNNLLLQK